MNRKKLQANEDGGGGRQSHWNSLFKNHAGRRAAATEQQRSTLSETAGAIEDARHALEHHLKKLQGSAAWTNAIAEELRHQLMNVMRELQLLQAAAERNLELRGQRLDRFSVTLFGRKSPASRR